MALSPANSYASDEVKRLLDSVRGGASEALGRLLEICRLYLLSVANQELPDDLQAKAGASDLVQETFLKAQQEFASFRGHNEGELRGWLRRILLNHLTDVTREYRDTDKREIWREVSLAVVSLSPNEAQGDAPSPCSQVIAEEQAEFLRRALGHLLEEARQVIHWRNYERCSFEEIGRRLGRSAEAARKVWSRALTELERHVETPHESG